jgi:hypothetical protein
VKAYRIALRAFGANKREAFSGLGGFSADGRWHSRGRHLDYAAESLSLAVLERLIHYKHDGPFPTSRLALELGDRRPQCFCLRLADHPVDGASRDTGEGTQDASQPFSSNGIRISAGQMARSIRRSPLLARRGRLRP